MVDASSTLQNFRQELQNDNFAGQAPAQGGNLAGLSVLRVGLEACWKAAGNCCQELGMGLTSCTLAGFQSSGRLKDQKGGQKHSLADAVGERMVGMLEG